MEEYKTALIVGGIGLAVGVGLADVEWWKYRLQRYGWWVFYRFVPWTVKLYHYAFGVGQKAVDKYWARKKLGGKVTPVYGQEAPNVAVVDFESGKEVRLFDLLTPGRPCVLNLGSYTCTSRSLS